MKYIIRLLLLGFFIGTILAFGCGVNRENDGNEIEAGGAEDGENNQIVYNPTEDALTGDTLNDGTHADNGYETVQMAEPATTNEGDGQMGAFYRGSVNNVVTGSILFTSALGAGSYELCFYIEKNYTDADGTTLVSDIDYVRDSIKGATSLPEAEIGVVDEGAYWLVCLSFAFDDIEGYNSKLQNLTHEIADHEYKHRGVVVEPNQDIKDASLTNESGWVVFREPLTNFHNIANTYRKAVFYNPDARMFDRQHYEMAKFASYTIVMGKAVKRFTNVDTSLDKSLNVNVQINPRAALVAASALAGDFEASEHMGPGQILSPYALKGTFYQNPVFGSGFNSHVFGLPNVNLAPDPFILKATGQQYAYYLYHTSNNNYPEYGYPVYGSSNMVDWYFLGDAFPNGMPNGWVTSGPFWAPEVFEYNGMYYLVHNGASRTLTDGQSNIGIASSPLPEGPFAATDAPLIDLVAYDIPAAIDGNVFIDDDGRKYLYFTSNASGNIRNYGVELADDFKSIIGEPSELVVSLFWGPRPDGLATWEHFSPVNEGPAVFKANGKYYMIYSANGFASNAYMVGYAVAENPLGPYIKSEFNPILYGGNTNVPGTGHNNFTYSPDGREMVNVYHSILSQPNVLLDSSQIGGVFRVLNINVMGLAKDRYGNELMYINGPTMGITPLPSNDGGYNVVKGITPVVASGNAPSGEGLGLVRMLTDGAIAIHEDGIAFAPGDPVDGFGNEVVPAPGTLVGDWQSRFDYEVYSNENGFARFLFELENMADIRAILLYRPSDGDFGQIKSVSAIINGETKIVFPSFVNTVYGHLDDNGYWAADDALWAANERAWIAAFGELAAETVEIVMETYAPSQLVKLSEIVVIGR